MSQLTNLCWKHRDSSSRYSYHNAILSPALLKFVTKRARYGKRLLNFKAVWFHQYCHDERLACNFWITMMTQIMSATFLTIHWVLVTTGREYLSMEKIIAWRCDASLRRSFRKIAWRAKVRRKPKRVELVTSPFLPGTSVFISKA